MKQTTFTEGVIVALIAALGGTALFTLFTTVLPTVMAVKLLISGGGLLYALYLLRRSQESIGRIVTLAVWLLAVMAGWLTGLSLPLFILLHIGMLWLTRSLYFYSGVFPALADLGLNILALAAAYWVMVQTQSMALTLWSFFLTQALFVYIPTSSSEPSAASSQQQHDSDRFAQALQTAESAVRKMSTHY